MTFNGRLIFELVLYRFHFQAKPIFFLKPILLPIPDCSSLQVTLIHTPLQVQLVKPML